MAEHISILFIINPIGKKRKLKAILSAIKNHLDPKFSYAIEYWKDPRQDFKEIIQKYECDELNTIVAVGGDGTVNKVANAIMFSNKQLGILPFGSGNGLARHLNIPMHPEKAIKVINKMHSEKIDSCKINDRYFMTTSGVGFDAKVSSLFAKSSKRGLSTYIRHVVTHYFTYKSKQYQLNIDGKKMNEKAFLITFANAGQYGGNAIIAPGASLLDGKLDVVILHKPHLYQLPFMALALFIRKIDRFSTVRVIKAKEIQLSQPGQMPVHYDGENLQPTDRLNIKVESKILNIIVPSTFKG